MKFKTRFSQGLIVSILLTIPLVYTGEKSSLPLKIISFNIRYDSPRDGKNSWSLRREMVAQTIVFHGVDVLGLQEVLKHQILQLAELLPGYSWIGVGREDGIDQGEYVPVFYLKTRLSPLESGHFWLSETPKQPGSMGWDAACPRIVTWVKFLDRYSNHVFYFFNTHFDHIGQMAREQSARLLKDSIETIAENDPTVVTGDFNCISEEKAYLILTSGSSALKDTHKISRTGHYGGTQTYNGFSEKPQAGRIIDFIFVRSTGPVDKQGIIADRWDGRYVSDHYPVFAEVNL
jgi:endonuclease/exonuclease/phosphatase family metal-dependent hydrolase